MPAHGSMPSSARSVKIHRLPQSRTASSVASPTARWSDWLSRFMNRTSWPCDDDAVGPAHPHHLAQPTPQRHAVLDHAVLEVEEVDDVDPDEPRRLDLLGLAGRPGLVGVHRVDPRLAAEAAGR